MPGQDNNHSPAPSPEIPSPIVSGRTKTVTATFARPADTTAYTAKDVVSNNATTTTFLAFTALGRTVDGSGYIVKARLETDQATCTARFRLWLYRVPNASLATAVGGDNAQFAVKWANRTSRIGYLDFPALATEGTGSDAAVALNNDIRMAFGAASDDTGLYGVLEALDAFTPNSAQNFFVALTAEQN